MLIKSLAKIDTDRVDRDSSSPLPAPLFNTTHLWCVFVSDDVTCYTGIDCACSDDRFQLPKQGGNYWGGRGRPRWWTNQPVETVQRPTN